MTGKGYTPARRLMTVGLVIGLLTSAVFAEKKQSSRQRSDSQPRKTAVKQSSTSGGLRHCPLGRVTTEVVIVREKPTTECHRVVTLVKGAEIRILGKRAGFYQVKTTKKGLVGWILWKYVETEHPDQVTLLAFDKKSKSYAAEALAQKQASPKPASLAQSKSAPAPKSVVQTVALTPNAASAQQPTLSARAQTQKATRKFPLTTSSSAVSPPAMTRISPAGEAVIVDPATDLLLKGLDSDTPPLPVKKSSAFAPLLTTPSLASRPLVEEGSIVLIVESEKNGEGRKLVNAAMAYRGARYRRGADLPSRGFDCSGLVYHVLRSYGFKSSPRTAAELFDIGTRVAKSELKEGDLVFFANTYKRGISHVGIYIGGGKFIHASSRGGQVTINSLDEDFYAKHYAGARRVVKE